MSDSVRPHRRQPTRPLCPWDSPGKNTGVGCHFLLTCHSKHPFPTMKRWLYTWTSPNGQYQNQIDYILCSKRWRSSIQSAKTRPGADCDSDNQLLIVKFRLKLKKLGKNTSPFKYDLNKIPHDYTVEVTNRFKGRESM